MAGAKGGPSNAVLAILAAVVLAAGAFAVGARFVHDQRVGTPVPRPSGLPKSVPTPVADLMGLSTVPDRPAPSFALTDQRGRPVSLAGLRGRVVVLEFMDPHCTDICPIVSKELVDAQRALGATSSKVAFVAINVNQYHEAVREMAAFSAAHQLDTIPSWRFATGATAALRRVWHDYGIVVQAPNPDADVVHSSYIFFIDPSGHERYLADPVVDHTASGTAYLPVSQMNTWARGIALVAASLAT